MAPQTQTEEVLQVPRRWSPGSLIAFRFCFVYFGLFCLTSQIFPSLIPATADVPELGTLWPFPPIVFWTAAHLFHAKLPLVYGGSGSGDKTFDWVLVFCLVVFAVIATAVWSLLDRHRHNHIALHKWFRLLIRFALVSQMFVYGMTKVIPLQMSFPGLTKLVEPMGNFSPMSVLWFFVGSAPAYEIFAGSAEMLAGLLLVFPRATTFGALVCLADSIQIFTLNMTYDVPVKLFSFHLILMSLVLLAPDLRALAAFFFGRGEARLSPDPPLFRAHRANSIAFAAQLALAIALLGLNVYNDWKGWFVYGGGRPKPPLYGIWDVDETTGDASVHWHRIIVDLPGRATFQHPDDSFAQFNATFSEGKKTLTLTKAADKSRTTVFAVERPAKDRLILDGQMDGHALHMQLSLRDREKFLIVTRGFHWIQEFPFGR